MERGTGDALPLAVLSAGRGVGCWSGVGWCGGREGGGGGGGGGGEGGCLKMSSVTCDALPLAVVPARKGVVSCSGVGSSALC